MRDFLGHTAPGDHLRTISRDVYGRATGCDAANEVRSQPDS